METRGNWTDLVGGVGLEIAGVHNQAMEEYIPGISNLLIKTSEGSKAEKHFTGKTGAGRLRKFDGDGENIGTTRRYKTYDTKVNYINYGEAIEVSKNQIMDRDFERELNEMADLTISANFSQDESGMQLFNGGFATTVAVNGYDMAWYGDGKPQFSTIHPTTVPGGSTQSNASSTSIAFGDTNLETGKVAMKLQQTDDGLPMSLLGKETLVGPTNLEKQMQQVTMSDRVSENANNALNVYKGNIDLVTSMFLDDTNANTGTGNTAWYLIVPGRTRLFHEVRQPVELESQVNVRNKVATFTIDARWANYSLGWQRSWASKGDLSAYSS